MSSDGNYPNIDSGMGDAAGISDLTNRPRDDKVANMTPMEDVIVAMQQRNRSAVHSLKGVQAKLQNEAMLLERRIRRNEAISTVELVETLQHLARVLGITVEGMQSDI